MKLNKTSASLPLPFAKITPIKPVNPEFTLVKIYICSPGKNRNMIFISEDELNNALPTLPYVPIVGHMFEKVDKDGNHIGYQFGGHDVEVTEDYELKPITRPFGVVTDSEPQYETVIEFGKEKTYLTSYGILWTGRWPELKEAAYDEETWFGQSMEVNFGDYSIYEEDSAYTELHDLTFSALCILGKSDDPKENVRPCFPSARIDQIKFDLNGEQFCQAMAEMQKQLSFCFEDNSFKKGGNIGLEAEKIQEIFAQAGLTTEEVDFEITDSMTEDQLKASIEAFKAARSESAAAAAEPSASSTPADHVDAQDTNTDGEPALFSATMNQKREAIRNALDPIVERAADGKLISEVSYWVEDFDDDYAYIERNYWSEGNYECKHGRMKYSFDDENKVATIISEFEEMFQMWLTKDEVGKIENDRKELEILRKYKADIEQEKFDATVEAMFAEFEDLSSLEEYKELKNSAADFQSIDELEMRLFALRGKQVKKKPAAATFSVKVGLDGEPSDGEDRPYGGLFDKYDIKPQK